MSKIQKNNSQKNIKNNKILLDVKSQYQDVVPIEELNSMMEEHMEFLGMVLNLLEIDESEDPQRLREKILDGEVDEETDLLCRKLERKVPYTFIMPYFRDLVGLTINTEKDCVDGLKELIAICETSDVNKEEYSFLYNAIDFVNGGELDTEVPPHFNLKLIMDKLPIEKHLEIYKLCDYLEQITDLEEIET